MTRLADRLDEHAEFLETLELPITASDGVKKKLVRTAASLRAIADALPSTGTNSSEDTHSGIGRPIIGPSAMDLNEPKGGDDESDEDSPEARGPMQFIKTRQMDSRPAKVESS